MTKEEIERLLSKALTITNTLKRELPALRGRSDSEELSYLLHRRCADLVGYLMKEEGLDGVVGDWDKSIESLDDIKKMFVNFSDIVPKLTSLINHEDRGDLIEGLTYSRDLTYALFNVKIHLLGL